MNSKRPAACGNPRCIACFSPSTRFLTIVAATARYAALLFCVLSATVALVMWVAA